MRVFTALELPTEIRFELAEQLDAARSLFDLRWVADRNLHLTVRFLGECGAREVDRQREHWRERSARVAPFDLRLQSVGCFPQPWRASVLYAEVAEGRVGWRKLSGVDDVPHVTVARASQPTDLTGLVDRLGGLSTQTWTADSVVMYSSSIARGRPPIYAEVERFALGG